MGKAAANLTRKDPESDVLGKVLVCDSAAEQEALPEGHCPTSSGFCQIRPVLDLCSLLSAQADDPLPDTSGFAARDQTTKRSTLEPLIF